jgi:hypothetical protein
MRERFFSQQCGGKHLLTPSSFSAEDHEPIPLNCPFCSRFTLSADKNTTEAENSPLSITISPLKTRTFAANSRTEQFCKKIDFRYSLNK